jgi:regulatory protein
MVRFESADEQATRLQQEKRVDELAPVTYLPGAAPGMKRRSPLEGRERTAADPADVVSLPVRRMGGPIDGLPADEDTEQPDTEQPDDEAAERERAENLLLQRLRGRSLSAAEAKAALLSTNLDETELDEIIERFTALHYLDDEKLADQILHSHHERKGLGRNGVEAEMRRRKIPHNVILNKLEEIPDDEEERAVELAVKRVKQLERFDDQTIDRRLTGFLMRKGYSSSAVRVAVKAALASRGGGSTVRFR